MTKSRTRKAATPKKQTEPEAPKAMDPSVQEQTVPVTQSRNARDCYALLTLVDEATDVFPEVSYETSNPNAFNTNLVVAFDDKELPDLYPLLALVESDPRVKAVDRDSLEDVVMVEFHNSLRTQDSRAPFGLAEAHKILTGESDEQWAENDERLTEGDE